MFTDTFSRRFLNVYFVLPILLLAYMTTLGFYRLKFHPYTKYPGPLLAKLTNLYGRYRAYLGDLHLDVWRCHQRYGAIIRIHPSVGCYGHGSHFKGDYVRYAPDRLCVNTNDAIKGTIWLARALFSWTDCRNADIYGYGKIVQKSQAYGPLPIYPGAFNTHTAID